MDQYQQHPDENVRQALIKLCDAICRWERSTGRTSALILKEAGGFSFRASSGKPFEDDVLSDSDFISMETQSPSI
jgi:hypothetical protein